MGTNKEVRRKHFPVWIRKRIPVGINLNKVSRVLQKYRLNTVCQSALCPNIGECFSSGTATFMIMGDICTRNCRFCAIKKGQPLSLEEDEPERIANAAEELGLKYVVVTSVTRDDLEDGGASHFAKVIRKVKEKGIKIEVLIPDFKGNIASLQKVIQASPDVINHNLETVPSLYPIARPLANFDTSIKILRYIKRSGIITKTGIMVGLGETQKEVCDLIRKIVDICDIFTIGQYLQPTKTSLTVKEFILPVMFEYYRDYALTYGIKKVIAGPFVRSSYHASEVYTS